MRVNTITDGDDTQWCHQLWDIGARAPRLFARYSTTTLSNYCVAETPQNNHPRRAPDATENGRFLTAKTAIHYVELS